MATFWIDDLAVLQWCQGGELAVPPPADHPGLDPVPQEPADDRSDGVRAQPPTPLQ